MRICIVIASLLFAGNVSAQLFDHSTLSRKKQAGFEFHIPHHLNLGNSILHNYGFHDDGFSCSFNPRFFHPNRLYYSNLQVRKGKKFTYYLIRKFQNDYNAGHAVHPEGVDTDLSRKLIRIGIFSRPIYKYMLRRLAIRSI